MKAKQISINGLELFYITYYDCSEYGESYETIFYEKMKTVTYKKYWLFGPVMTKEEPDVLFSIYEDSNNKRINKDWWRNRILHEISLLNRKEEIEAGKLI